MGLIKYFRELGIFVLCGFVISLLGSSSSYAATKKIAAAEQTTEMNANAEKDKKLQEIYDWLENKLNNLSTSLYLREGTHDHTLSIDYKLLKRNGCEIYMDNYINFRYVSHFISNPDRVYEDVSDVSSNSIKIDMTNVQSVNITRQNKNACHTYASLDSDDIINKCISVNLNSIVNGITFIRNKFNRDITRSDNSDEPNPKKQHYEDSPGERNFNFDNYSLCISDNNLAERLVRAFNDYRKICGAKDELY